MGDVIGAVILGNVAIVVITIVYAFISSIIIERNKK